ncbi:MAG: hypothetical protein H6713_04360 [Myxococcales bacterium]|nr:hypothetical protein [Myxococcales bacterium]
MRRRVPQSTRQRLLTGAAPLALAVVAALQLTAAHVYGLSPWKGGGFGMFSTVDSPSARFVVLALVTEDGARPVPVPDAARREAAAARAPCRRARARELAVARHARARSRATRAAGSSALRSGATASSRCPKRHVSSPSG